MAARGGILPLGMTSLKFPSRNGMVAALSHQSDFSVGCYCPDESRCHRSVLRALLEERGAKIG